MFQSLDEQMKHDDALETTPGERMIKWAVIAVENSGRRVNGWYGGM
jgi:hypothetical protein